MLAWHFLPENRRLQYADTPVELGKTIRVNPPLSLCHHGLHASLRLIDALQYAPGPIICRVEMGGEIVKGDDKLCASKRTVIAWADATPVLHEFACRCAEKALRTAKVEDVRCWEAIEAKRKWLCGEATDAEIDAARSAAESAAWSAARSAWSAAWSAARSAANASQNRQLTSMVSAILGKG